MTVQIVIADQRQFIAADATAVAAVEALQNILRCDHASAVAFLIVSMARWLMHDNTEEQRQAGAALMRAAAASVIAGPTRDDAHSVTCAAMNNYVAAHIPTNTGETPQ